MKVTDVPGPKKDKISLRKSIIMTFLIYILKKGDWLIIVFSESEFDSHVEFITQNGPDFVQAKAQILKKKPARLSRVPRHAKTMKVRLKNFYNK